MISKTQAAETLNESDLALSKINFSLGLPWWSSG